MTYFSLPMSVILKKQLNNYFALCFFSLLLQSIYLLVLDYTSIVAFSSLFAPLFVKAHALFVLKAPTNLRVFLLFTFDNIVPIS